MYLQETLEVVIGVIFAWMLLSIAVMQIQEIIATFTAKRSQELEKVLREILGDPAKVKQFYNHPLIKSLAKKKDLKEEDKDRLEGKTKRRVWERWQLGRPAYIPSSNFATAVFDIVIDAGTENSRIRATINKMKPEINKLKQDDQEKVNAIVAGIYQLGQTAANSKAGTEFQAGVKNELRRQINCLGADYEQLRPFAAQLAASIDSSQYNLGAVLKSEPVMEQLRAGAQILVQQKSPLGESLNSLFTGVEEYALNTDQGLAQGRKNVETWYDSTMDQLNGSYKRWAQWWAFGIGLIIAFAFNVDSIFIAQELWHTPATRIATAAYVQQFTEKKGTNLTTTDIQDMNLALQALHFPVGWKIDDRPRDLWWGVLKFFGCLITALAAMQGAPFWFDTLKKIVNVRSAGVNPVEKPKESASAA